MMRCAELYTASNSMVSRAEITGDYPVLGLANNHLRHYTAFDRTYETTCFTLQVTTGDATMEALRDGKNRLDPLNIEDTVLGVPSVY